MWQNITVNLEKTNLNLNALSLRPVEDKKILSLHASLKRVSSPHAFYFIFRASHPFWNTDQHISNLHCHHLLPPPCLRTVPYKPQMFALRFHLLVALNAPPFFFLTCFSWGWEANPVVHFVWRGLKIRYSLLLLNILLPDDPVLLLKTFQDPLAATVLIHTYIYNFFFYPPCLHPYVA